MLLTNNKKNISPHIYLGDASSNKYSPVGHPGAARHYESVDEGTQHRQHVEQEVQHLKNVDVQQV